MKPTGFQITMYKSILDSGWIEIEPLTVLVGKNESGKTSFLRALQKFNPYTPDPYSMAREWPRGHRDERSKDQVVCAIEFALSDEERAGLRELTDHSEIPEKIRVSKDYEGRFEVLFPEEIFPDRLHPHDVDAIIATLPPLPDQLGEPFQKIAAECISEAKRLAHEGRFSELTASLGENQKRLQQAMSSGEQQPQHNLQNQFLTGYSSKLQAAVKQLEESDSIQDKAHEFIIERLPTFVYMDEYRAFSGTADLEEVQQRSDKKRLTDEDKTILTLFGLSGLDLKDQVAQAAAKDRTERRYDLSDAGATLTEKIAHHWGQRKYEVEFDADGAQFFTFVRDEKDKARIKLEERSRGFQWFFSFDLLLMYETKGTLRDCVILLDEPGLHLHPEGQQDLLKRLEAYAEGNTLLYSTHLPFMIDLERPERIRVISETLQGAKVTTDLTQSQPEGKLTLQAALGISGRTSFLVAEQNLVVEGVDDYWILSSLSNLFRRSEEEGLPEHILVTPAGGASEVTYIATFMIGQQLDVVALYDSDQAGDTAKEKLVKKWLTHYPKARVTALSVASSVKAPATVKQMSIEDLFPETFYRQFVVEAYVKQFPGIQDANLPPGEQLSLRFEALFENQKIKFNKGSVAKRLCSGIGAMKTVKELPKETTDRVRNLFAEIRKTMVED